MCACVGEQQGQLYNAEDGRKALRDVFALGLFDNVQIFPKPNQKDESKVCTAPHLSCSSCITGQYSTLHTPLGVSHGPGLWACIAVLCVAAHCIPMLFRRIASGGHAST